MISTESKSGSGIDVQANPVDVVDDTDKTYPSVEATVRAVGVDAVVAETIVPLAVHRDLSTKFDVSGATISHDEPLYTFIPGSDVLKYRAPATRGLPSLSTDGSEFLAPRYLSSNESQAASARIAEVLAATALAAAEAAEVEAAI